MEWMLTSTGWIEFFFKELKSFGLSVNFGTIHKRHLQHFGIFGPHHLHFKQPIIIICHKIGFFLIVFHSPKLRMSLMDGPPWLNISEPRSNLYEAFSLKDAPCNSLYDQRTEVELRNQSGERASLLLNGLWRTLKEAKREREGKGKGIRSGSWSQWSWSQRFRVKEVVERCQNWKRTSETCHWK